MRSKRNRYKKEKMIIKTFIQMITMLISTYISFLFSLGMLMLINNMLNINVSINTLILIVCIPITITLFIITIRCIEGEE